MNLPITDMAYETFEKIISRIPKADAVILSGWGEPLLHPDFFEMVRLINEALPRVSVKFTTNGLLLDEETRKQIFNHRIARVSISIDQLPPISSDKGQIGHPTSDEVLQNVSRLVKERGSRKQPQIWLQSVIQRNGASKIDDLIEFAGRTGIDGVSLVRLEIRDNPGLPRPDWEEEREIIRGAKITAKRAGVRLFCINDHNPAMRLAGHFDKYCLRTDDSLYIDVEGNVAPCCSLRDYRCGNLGERSLSEIWNNQRFEKFRKNQPRICDGCDALTYKYR
jgi:MoaA/NifB/PqqE/SkfB family radical SAM enzyme